MVPSRTTFLTKVTGEDRYFRKTELGFSTPLLSETLLVFFKSTLMQF